MDVHEEEIPEDIQGIDMDAETRADGQGRVITEGDYVVKDSFSVDKQLEGEAVDVTVHDTPEELAEDYFGFPLEEAKGIGGYDEGGEEYYLTVEEFLASIKKTKCWGFLNQKNRIVLWFDKDVPKRDLISLLAHERGHMMRPYRRDQAQEEIKAGRYEKTAEFAYDLAGILLQTKR